MTTTTTDWRDDLRAVDACYEAMNFAAGFDSFSGGVGRLRTERLDAVVDRQDADGRTDAPGATAVEWMLANAGTAGQLVACGHIERAASAA